MEQDRRAFLKALARRAAYAAPVILSVTAPSELHGQSKGSQHKHFSAPRAGTGGAQQPASRTLDPGGAPPPWKAPPPGDTSR